ncbi:MAG: Bro-N domain-containing protein [Prevotella sp.]|nr:Bro-N domain-containing protein [Prevotella sp.]
MSVQSRYQARHHPPNWESGSNYKTHAIFINESGLYSLVLSSKLPRAESSPTRTPFIGCGERECRQVARRLDDEAVSKHPMLPSWKFQNNPVSSCS